MTLSILLAGIIIFSGIFLDRFTKKYGVPVLLAFILLGIIFGSDGIFKIHFENYKMVEQVCSAALIIIIFYGGFGTSWSSAKPVAKKAILLSTLGVVLTMLFVGLFCFYILNISILESFLIGALVSSTDAASVFSILRSKKLGLKYNTASLLELESGSNDPASYTLTILMLILLKEGFSLDHAFLLIFKQFFFGILIGFALAFFAVYLLKKIEISSKGYDLVYLLGIALLAFGLSNVIGGNGYLSVYICGIYLGNQKIKQKKAIVHFFDGITGLLQILIFFLLGLLATPSLIAPITMPALAIMLFLSCIARPLAIAILLFPLKCPWQQIFLVSFAGLRGVASIVFAIIATINVTLTYDVYHIVFFIVLLSITFQGTLLPWMAKKLKMIDPSINVLKTFSDYSGEVDMRFIKVHLQAPHLWVNQKIKEIVLPPETLIIMLIRDEKKLVASGHLTLLDNDELVLGSYKFREAKTIRLQEYQVGENSEWINHPISEFSPADDEIVIMIIRKQKTIIPKGTTKIKKNDILILHTSNKDRSIKNNII